MSESTEARLAALGITLPPPPAPQGSYQPARRVGNLVYTSGMSAIRDGQRQYVGRLGAEISVEDGYASARGAAINCLAAVRSIVATLDAVEAVISLTGYVRSAPEFDRQPKVVDGASDLLTEVFGEKGRHTRAAIGVSELPFGISVEALLVVALRDGPATL